MYPTSPYCPSLYILPTPLCPSQTSSLRSPSLCICRLCSFSSLFFNFVIIFSRIFHCILLQHILSQPLHQALASTFSLRLYTKPQPLHPASSCTTEPSINIQPLLQHSTSVPISSPVAASTSSILSASTFTPGLSLYIQPLFPHSISVHTSSPVPVSTSGISLYIRPQPLHPAPASTSSQGLITQTQPLHPASTSSSILSFYIQP